MAKSIKGNSAAAVQLSADLRVTTAAATFAALREAARAPGKAVILDARQVEKVDAAGLQALLAGRMALLRAEKDLSWNGCPVVLRSAAELLGLAEALELPR